MKKSLIALAALVVSSAAMAQSSVTLYGSADVALVKSSGSGLRMADGNTDIVNDGIGRLGVKGVEDLGSGLKVSFAFEQAINQENGKTAANTWARAAWLALDGGFGSLKLGRATNPSLFSEVAWELTGLAGYSVTANQFSIVGGSSRNNSQIMYTTPKFGGFSSAISYVAKADSPAAASRFDLNLIYQNGPLGVGFGYNKTQGAQGNTALGANYNFGSFIVAGSVHNNAGPSKGFTLGGTVPLGAFSVTLDIGRETGTGLKNTDVSLSGKYNLSKRTYVYSVIYADGAAPGGVYATGAKNHFGLGINHSF